ncbi:MAG: hypothetical protein ACRDA5_03055 [Clostridium sp.]
MKNKRFFTVGILSGIIIVGAIYFWGNLYNKGGWTYIKINDKTYVANSSVIHKDISPKQIGGTQHGGIAFIKPTKNGVGNGIPYGIPIYEGDTNNSIFIENKDGYIKLISTESENWEDGVKMKVEDYQLVEP